MEHLPECNYQKNPDRNVCICERLRACEDRVSKDFFMAGYAAGYGEETLAVSRKRGYSDAIAAAVQRVEALFLENLSSNGFVDAVIAAIKGDQP